MWLAIAIWYIAQRWGAIHWLSLGDTDDNMRLMQVRGLLDGQGWYDLRQYRLNPPAGFDIHWSRLVDLPIAALILIFKPFVGTGQAERLACGIAPLLPLSITMAGLAFTTRRLVHPLLWPLALVFLLFCGVMLPMFLPMRIDHHGWQLAMLSLTVAGLADDARRRGGLMVGLASAVSLTIGLEMLPYCAMAGAILALRWIWDRAEAPRLAAYAVTLGGGCAAGFAAFASNANQALRCDALTPVWLSVMVAAGALLLVLALANPAARSVRCALAILAGGAIAIGFALVFPQCLGRPEQVSPELARTWLNHVREAKPIYEHPFRAAFPIAALPVIGLIGGMIATWRARGNDNLVGWVTVTLFSGFATAMLLWQVRAGPAAQLLAVPGVTALAWFVLPWFRRQPSVLVRVAGPVTGFLLLSGFFASLMVNYLPIDRPNARTKIISRASRTCPTIPSLTPLDRLPPQVVFTFVDLGPRLITLTHHDAIAGPYHRNGDAILDVQHGFGGSPERFRAIAKKHHATLLMVCPNMPESTVYRARSPGGFYDQLAQGKTFDWLEPVAMPAKSPIRVWKIK
ncbi:AcrB/AcrD/AcrF family protein [Hephaestia sp. GCM10023244]|uniref:AcrB/AcrD/AcrF family protein n=1 Tax=unclassified Hephaestia TaxID=2631281 RepID=UPI002076FC3B|nr:AcrB/AcrD/AcrF family protein [Hephaestia sp. MAHUQ-44]MCM8732229.1 AcrB/AcrD/AcrF family protein [Hephaestia sp. MAHUQ-44]